MLCCRVRHSLLLKYLQTFLRCIITLRWADDSICDPFWFTPCHFYEGQLPNCTQKYTISCALSAQHMIWDIVLQGVASIAIGMALNLPYMDKEYRGTLMIASTSDLWFLPRLFCQYHVSNCVQNARFCGYPLGMGNRMLCWNERYPLLLKCLQTFLRCTRMIGGADHSIYNPLMVHTTRIPPRSTLQLYTKYQILGRYPLSMESRMMCCKERHPLLLKCLKTFLTCTKRMRLMSFPSLLWFTPCCFFFKNNPQIAYY